MFSILEYFGRFYVVEADYDWIADIRNNREDAEKSASFYNNGCQGEPPFPDLQQYQTPKLLGEYKLAVSNQSLI